MGTRGNYIFRHKGKYYVFYNHWDSYFTGLGGEIVAELRAWTAEDFELAKRLLDSFTVDPTDGGENFKGLLPALQDPAAYCLMYIGDDEIHSPDGQYSYTLDFDHNLFIVRWAGEEVWESQRYRLNNIPEDWIDLTGKAD